MSTDDPRHGTYAGYVAGCRNDCCRTAARRYQKRRVYEGKPRRVSSLGTRRRIEALACLGWDMYAIARHLGTGRDTVRQWTMHETVYRRTHERMVAVYDELSMRLPPQDTKDQRANVAKTRNRAARMGWYPPLSWDEGAIDDPDARPYNYVEPKPTKPRRSGAPTSTRAWSSPSSLGNAATPRPARSRRSAGGGARWASRWLSSRG
jgi:hypothetical protein